MTDNSGRLTASGGWYAPRSALDALGITITDQEPPMNTPRTYVKKPVAVRAMQWDGDNTDAVERFTHGGFKAIPLEERTEKQRANDVYALVWDYLHSTWVGVKANQWIIEGVLGEFYPCDDDVFSDTYEERP